MSKKGLSGPGQRARIWGLPSPYAPNPHQGLSFPVAPPVPGALIWNPFLGETHEPDNTTPPFPQNDPNLGSCDKSPERDTRPQSLRPPLKSTAILDTASRDKSRKERLPLALVSEAQELPLWLYIRPAIP